MKKTIIVTELLEQLINERMCNDESEGMFSKGHLLNMLWCIKHMILPDDLSKANRWIGFVQGVLACKGVVPVKEMIELTRPIYKGE